MTSHGKNFSLFYFYGNFYVKMDFFTKNYGLFYMSKVRTFLHDVIREKVLTFLHDASFVKLRTFLHVKSTDFFT